jgi:hypothetical protein
MENCKCGQNKVRTEVDGRFVYQVCDACDDVIQVVYLGPKEEADDDIGSEMLGL